MDDFISIGRFSNLTRLSIDTLRKLDERGWLRPVYVNPDTRYRYYAYAQLRRATLIRFCRELEMPGEEIRDMLDRQEQGRDEGLLDHLLRHRARLTESIAARQRLLAVVEEELARTPRPIAYEVTLREEPETLVVAASGWIAYELLNDHLAIERSLDVVGERLYEWLRVHGLVPFGPPVTVYLSEVEEREDLLFEVCAPLEQCCESRARDAAGDDSRLRVHRLPAAKLAAVVHRGFPDTIWNAYAELYAWVWEEGLLADGPIREMSLEDPREATDSFEPLVEIALPVRVRPEG